MRAVGTNQSLERSERIVGVRAMNGFSDRPALSQRAQMTWIGLSCAWKRNAINDQVLTAIWSAPSRPSKETCAIALRGDGYAGRIAEDVKLVAGIWVRVGPLGNRLLKHLTPEVRGIIIVSESRHYVSVLAVPSRPAIAKSQTGRARALAKLTELAEQVTGSSQRAQRLSFLTKSLSINAGDFTEKDSLGQHRIVRRYADLIEALRVEKPAASGLAVDLESPASISTNI